MTHRTHILETANNLITGDRAEAYGDFGEQMLGVSRAFEAITGKQLSPSHVALILQILKLRRFETARDDDSMIDLAGYAALRGQYFGPDHEGPDGPTVVGGFDHLKNK